MGPLLVGRQAEAYDAAVGELAEEAFAFLERLVAARSTLGEESAAQQLVAEQLDALGFAVTHLPVPDSIAEHPLAGVPQASYVGRGNVLGRLNGSEPGLLFNGHIDVVPAEPATWSADPYRPQRGRGWLVGRGAGDMKGGFAMTMLALRALASVAPEALEQPIAFLSVIEEECTGNGTLAAVLQGVAARAVILPEPSDLGLLLAGVGVVWVDVILAGRGGHAEAADRLSTPLTASAALLAAFEKLSADWAQHYPDDQLEGVAQPYNVNVGLLECGDWRSSVASTARLGVRVGFPRGWSPDEALARVATAVEEALADDVAAGLAVRIEPTGFRAEGFALGADHDLARLVSDCHLQAHGNVPAAYGLGSTCDARYYLNQLGVPALCYGPVVRDIHGSDEAVLLESIVDGARTLGRVVAASGRWLTAGAAPVQELVGSSERAPSSP